MSAIDVHPGQNMEIAYSLYDALVSIDVPADRARAVVGAMERDMLNQVVMKGELRAELQLIRQEISSSRELLARDIQHQTTVMTVRLGSMIGAGFALLYALQRFS
jgi:hypothetical protein